MIDRFLRACRRQPVDRTPLWIMRQAGRYLPEYRELRSRADFLTVCRTPELAAEVTLQPLRRFALDAAILFADIMTPLDAFDIAMTFDPGPKIAEPIRTRVAVDRLAAKPAAEAVPYVAETIRLLRRRLDGTPLIGFCGAPFTLAAYLVQGEGKEGFGALKRWLFEDPATVQVLLEKLADAMADYVRLQVDAGAQAIQIFDSWAGILDYGGYAKFALPGVAHIIDAVRSTGVPVIYFLNGAPHLIQIAARKAAPDVLGVCWRTPLDSVAKQIGDDIALQGNLDPHALFAPHDVIRERVDNVLDRVSGRPGHIMNLGHGILPETPIAAVEALIDAVHSHGRARAGAL